MNAVAQARQLSFTTGAEEQLIERAKGLCPLRYWRDLHTASRHAVLLPDPGYEVYGRQLLGLTQTIIPAVVV